MTKANYHHGTLKEALIAKGLQLLNKEGVDGFSLRKVAVLCGVSHAAPYKHFQGKEELIAAIVEEVTASFRAALLQSLGQTGDQPLAQIREMGRQYVQFMVENPEYLKFLFLNHHFNPIRIDPSGFIIHENSTFTIFKDCATKYLQSLGGLAPVIDIMLLWSTVHGLAVLFANHSLETTTDYHEVVSQTIDRLLQGVSSTYR